MVRDGIYLYADAKQVVVNGVGHAVALHTNGEMWENVSPGNPVAIRIATGVVLFAAAPDGSLFTLTASGELDRFAAVGGTKSVVAVGYDEVQALRFDNDGRLWLQLTGVGSPSGNTWSGGWRRRA